MGHGGTALDAADAVQSFMRWTSEWNEGDGVLSYEKLYMSAVVGLAPWRGEEVAWFARQKHTPASLPR